ncbi:MAG TPA: DUF1887 family CARF protein [Ktedonobacteraceae bacterium]|nr:DUF1887 family CARF protein [Ktedonobacteraceae bacterium]
MENQKALLLLVGGRSLPNILTVIHEKPDFIATVSSKESEQKELKDLLQAINILLPSCEVKSFGPIDAYDVEGIKQACQEALAYKSEASWIFNITSATTIMSLAAYEVAKENASQKSIVCWYLNTARSQVISLVGEGRDSQIFSISVKDYALAYGRPLRSGGLDSNKSEQIERFRRRCENDWLPVARTLGKNPQLISFLKELIKRAGGKPKADNPKTCHSKMVVSQEEFAFLEDVQRMGLLSNLHRSKDQLDFKWDHLQAEFLNGKWLEIYTWNEVKEAGIFDDCQWGQVISNVQTTNELDVAATYKAHLINIECKTGSADASSKDTLYKLSTVSGYLGGNYVVKALVTSILPEADKNGQTKDYTSLVARAEDLHILFISSADLPNLREKLVSHAINAPKR